MGFTEFGFKKLNDEQSSLVGGLIEGTVTSINARRGSGVIMADNSRDQCLFDTRNAEVRPPTPCCRQLQK